MAPHEVTFEFLGQCFTLRSSLPEEEIKEVLAFLEEKKAEILKVKNVPAYKLAIWLLFQVAYEYLKAKKEKEALEEYLKAQSKRLADFLEKEMPTLGCS
ncbi:MAG: cell division protein ZapA [Thermodesulfobacterium sp.]|jgi:cell division protein ZapA|nr:cell division protein ZapA [Thermodesulfobacterium sp.]MCI4453641.1 cell division protein ZapA [Thermodesulfobacterium sp.]